MLELLSWNGPALHIMIRPQLHANATEAESGSALLLFSCPNQLSNQRKVSLFASPLLQKSYQAYSSFLCPSVNNANAGIRLQRIPLQPGAGLKSPGLQALVCTNSSLFAADSRGCVHTFRWEINARGPQASA